MNRFILNETSYHGAGAINAIADEAKAEASRRLSFAPTLTLSSSALQRRLLIFLIMLVLLTRFSPTSSLTQLSKTYRLVLTLSRLQALTTSSQSAAVLPWTQRRLSVSSSQTLNLLM